MSDDRRRLELIMRKVEDVGDVLEVLQLEVRAALEVVAAREQLDASKRVGGANPVVKRARAGAAARGKRDAEILERWEHGQSAKQIAKGLGISIHIVHNTVKRLRRELGLNVRRTKRPRQPDAS